jgi:hypothetical protein
MRRIAREDNSMPEKSLTRRTLFKVAAAASGIFLLSAGDLLKPLTASASVQPANASSGEIPQAASLTIGSVVDNFTDLEGIRAEYRAAIATFPLKLPTGWVFPAESSLRDPDSNALWERGNGRAEAYFFWQRSVASEAYRAHLRGDDALAVSYLDVLENGYDTTTRRAVLNDPNNDLVLHAIRPARGRDFSGLIPIAGA